MSDFAKRPRARPRFTLDVPLAPDAVSQRLRARLEAGDGTVVGTVFRGSVRLTVRPEDTHFWSPHLDIRLDEQPGGGTTLACAFGPHPHVWTGFVGVQLLFGLLSVTAGIWLTSMLTLGRDPWVAVGLLVLMLFGGGFSYGAAYVGQGIGSEQMYLLRSFLDDALKVAP